MTSNFIMNNFLTYRDQRLKSFAVLRGLLLFYLVCSVGLFANVGVAFSVYDQEPIWWLAGAAGALLGVVWNHARAWLCVGRRRGTLDDPAGFAAGPQHGCHDPCTGGAAAGRRGLDAADFRRSL